MGGSLEKTLTTPENWAIRKELGGFGRHNSRGLTQEKRHDELDRTKGPEYEEKTVIAM